MENTFMKNIVSKLSLKLIVLQIGFLYLFSQAAQRFYYSWNYEISECMYLNGRGSGFTCLEKHPGYTVTDLLVGPVYFSLYGLIGAAVIIGTLNWIRKKHVLNLLIVLVMYVLLVFGGAFKFSHDLDMKLISFGGILSSKFWAMNFIVVQIYFISGLVLLWLSVRNKLTLKTESDHVRNLQK